MSQPSAYVHKSHNVSILIYHLVCPAKYRRVVFDGQGKVQLTQVCLEIAQRYEIVFLEIGTDRDHVHFLLQSVPTLSPTQIVRTIKSLTGREVFRRLPFLKQVFWSGALWSSGYFINTVGRHGNEDAIRRYVQEPGREQQYQQHYVQQLSLFE